jgi:hypothetical protein
VGCKRVSFQFHHHLFRGGGTAVRQAHGPALGHELGPNGVPSKDTRFMHVLKQPHRTTSPQRRAFFVPVHRALSALGAVTGSGVFWVAEMKRDPLAPFESAVSAPLFMLLLGQDTSELIRIISRTPDNQWPLPLCCSGPSLRDPDSLSRNGRHGVFRLTSWASRPLRCL